MTSQRQQLADHKERLRQQLYKSDTEEDIELVIYALSALSIEPYLDNF